MRGECRLPFTRLKAAAAAAAAVVPSFAVGIAGIYLSMPASDSSFLKLPRTLKDLQILRDHLEIYTSDYTMQVLICYFAVYIFMQTFMIRGTVFLSLLAELSLELLEAWYWWFLQQLLVARRREKLLKYMLFLRVTPALPNTFISMASPIVDVPYHIFFLATLIGLIPAAYVTVRAGTTLGELKSVADLYDCQSNSNALLHRNCFSYTYIDIQVKCTIFTNRNSL
ncbi:hypothetical protein ZIOFF_027619 [Zingiber officinale]|uniref:Uncharacterized protein n=1 Tax=Zingiber officinale TaxID=94328 RepID=A0A8J5GT24_ZINOF|nr:hypothetical protein ZIOFF_027619 [Zingiber officinale]